jgi:hypothetical protein
MTLQEALKWAYESGQPATCRLNGEEVRLTYVKPQRGAGRFLLETWRNRHKVREELMSERIALAVWDKLKLSGPTLDLLQDGDA